MTTCYVCGEKNVTPFLETDIAVGILVLYSELQICDDCYDKLSDEELEALKEKSSELPF